jgi:putative MATE family efflux protein
MIVGLIAMMGFYLADTLFVAQLGSDALAAMSFTFPVVMTITSLGIGLMAGTSSVLSRRIGEGQDSQIPRLATDSLLLALVLSIGIAALGLATTTPLFRLLGANDAVLLLIHDYMDIWYLSLPLVLVPMAGIGAIRATGDSRGQSAVLIFSSVANLILDPLLIFGLVGLPRMELAGAAIASVLARLLSLGIGYYIFHVRHQLLDLRLPSPAQFSASIQTISRIALPAAGTNMVIPLASGVVTALVAIQGAEAVAGFGAAFRVEGFALIVFYALSAVIGPFVGQNLGAGHLDRVRDAVRQCMWFCLGFGLFLAVLLALGGQWIAGWFSDDSEVIQSTVLYFQIVPLSFATAGMVMIINAVFNGAGLPLHATGISLMRMLALVLPLATLGAAWGDLLGLYCGLLGANLLAGIIALVWWRKVANSLMTTAESKA